MKQRILVAIASVLLAALILLMLPPIHPAADLPTAPTNPAPSTPPTTQPTPGSVRLYSCDPETLPALAKLAADYTARTGVEVSVLTAGDTGCMPMLEMLMGGENPPTLLCMHSQQDLLKWQDSLLDLTGTALETALCSADFGFRSGGKLLGLPMAVEGMGLLSNPPLMSVVISRQDVLDMGLRTSVQLLEMNGVTAFANVPHGMPVWLRLLQSSDGAAMRDFLDLHMENQIGTGNPMDQFMSGKTAFFLGTTADYDQLSQQPDQELPLNEVDILPTGTGEGLHYLCKTAWGVNGNANPNDIDATLDFLQWMVTATEEGAAPIDQLQNLSPFLGAGWYGNQLEKKLRKYMQLEPAVLVWEAGDRNSRDLLLALGVYVNDPTDANWKAIEALLKNNG